MNFYGAFFAWIVMALVMVVAVVLAVKTSIWFLALAMVVFVVAFAKYGCLSH